MTVEKILTDWRKKQFKPLYWLEGEEDYFIHKLVDYAEHQLLSDSEKEFNLSVFYGKDADWASVVNACSRYPMFAERQLVLLKEAQQMREIDKLEAYIQKPLASTIFIVAYKEKKLDGRSRMAKLLKEKAVVFYSKKLYDNELPEWTQTLIREKGFSISTRALVLLIDHVGNDLSRLDNELDKILVNLGQRTQITEDDIELYVGVSKEYNVFELQAALGRKDLAKAIRIIQYFQGNPKAAPIQLVLPSLYSFFSKVYMLFGHAGEDNKSLAAKTGINPYFIEEYVASARNYGYAGTENALLLLHQYNLKSIGVNAPPAEDASLLRELVVKMLI